MNRYWRKEWMLLLFLIEVVSFPRKAAAVVCPPNNVCYQGNNAPVMVSPKIHLVLWGFNGTDPSGEIPFVTSTLTGLGWHWDAVVTQYYQTINGVQSYVTNAPTQFSEMIVDNTNPLPLDLPPPPGGGPTLVAWRNAVGAEALAMSATFGRSSNDLYIVFTPPRTNMPEQDQAFACGWHGSVAIPGGGNLAFADLPYGNLRVTCYLPTTVLAQLTSVTVHEIKEAVTDPFYQVAGKRAWSDNSNNEIGDYCFSYTTEKILPDYVTPNTISIPRVLSASANGGTCSAFTGSPTFADSNCCVASYTQNSYRFYVNSYAGTPGYLYTSLGGNACPTTGIWWTGNTLTGDVASTSWGPGRMDLFAADTNNHLQHMYSNDSGNTIYAGDDWGTPSGWTIIGTPAAASWGPNHLDVFMTAWSSSLGVALWHRMWNQNTDRTVTFTAWESWGAPPTDTLYYSAGVSAISDEPNRVDTYLLGTSQDGQYTSNLWQAWRMGSSGSPTWTSHGNPGAGHSLTGTPSVASWGAQRWDVFVEDYVGGDLMHWYFQGGCCTAWDNWGTLPYDGGLNFYQPSVIAMGDNRLNIYVQGRNTNSQYLRTWDFGDQGWTPLICYNPSNKVMSLLGTRY